MNETSIAQVLQNLGYVVSSESLVRSERQLERGALKMADDDVDIVRIDESHLRRLT